MPSCRRSATTLGDREGRNVELRHIRQSQEDAVSLADAEPFDQMMPVFQVWREALHTLIADAREALVHVDTQPFHVAGLAEALKLQAAPFPGPAEQRQPPAAPPAGDVQATTAVYELRKRIDAQDEIPLLHSSDTARLNNPIRRKRSRLLSSNNSPPGRTAAANSPPASIATPSPSSARGRERPA